MAKEHVGRTKATATKTLYAVMMFKDSYLLDFINVNYGNVDSGLHVVEDDVVEMYWIIQSSKTTRTYL